LRRLPSMALLTSINPGQAGAGIYMLK